MKVLPPMPGNIFLHYLEHAKRMASSKKEMQLYHADSTFLNRLPKRLEQSIFFGEATANANISYGWGIYIVDRPSIFAQNLVTGLVAFVSAIICLVIFGIIWATSGRDDAIGIGQYATGVLTLLNTAVYFYIQAYCSSLSRRN
ncbi:uncharacterized protein GGS22DRAFT_164944 [Annulohypoxylon maeteangense]|uniref:uncharacterized protein n=1 Tax=Annulohypoxylon maeteangense TaxID=1927788 RepID=UPI002007B13A|nr:uncharacterized protein GGS22DRAFT_164944 [Annulohypoxylon maeteangense]KAI0884136.1 hypothetical protein GGS22DRAFT_164944 [Annulohypoxylon maeteangense]